MNFLVGVFPGDNTRTLGAQHRFSGYHEQQDGHGHGRDTRLNGPGDWQMNFELTSHLKPVVLETFAAAESN